MARPRSTGRRTDYQWFSFGDIENAQDISTNTAFFAGSQVNFGIPGTVMRVRGRVGLVLDAGAVNEGGILLCALGIFSTEFVATGAANAPEIFGDGASDEASWLWQGSLFVTSGGESAVNTNGLNASIEIDSKAMRKIKPGQTLAMVYHLPAELWIDQTGTVDIFGYVHALIGT